MVLMVVQLFFEQEREPRKANYPDQTLGFRFIKIQTILLLKAMEDFSGSFILHLDEVI